MVPDKFIQHTYELENLLLSHDARLRPTNAVA